MALNLESLVESEALISRSTHRIYLKPPVVGSNQPTYSQGNLQPQTFPFFHFFLFFIGWTLTDHVTFAHCHK